MVSTVTISSGSGIKSKAGHINDTIMTRRKQKTKGGRDKGNADIGERGALIKPSNSHNTET